MHMSLCLISYSNEEMYKVLSQVASDIIEVKLLAVYLGYVMLFQTTLISYHKITNVWEWESLSVAQGAARVEVKIWGLK